jgi:hypothetical protein
MLSRLSSLARSSVVALAALSSLATAAPAAPLGPSFMPAVADSATLKPTLVQGEGRDKMNPAYQIWPRNRNWGGGGNWGGRNWNGGGRHWNGNGNWNGGGRHWNGGGNWNGGWGNRYAWRHGHWGHNNWNNWGPGFALGLGFGLPLGYYGGYYNNYGGYYDEPIYRPRAYRVYRGGSAHVQWCYDRYRSYRAWDNTFQPYNGPRQQCYSPYS